MSKTPSFLQGLMGLKCPQCRKGDLFTHSAYSGKHSEMPERCPHCGQKYEIETGFFWGAMYVAYALVCAIFIFYLILFLVFDLKWYVAGGAYVATVILLIPINVRYSRALLLYTFASISFKPELYRKGTQK